ncbi:MAG TPA: hypothetical protein VHE37_03170 [Nevskiaceae bacterium]|nr:hypothetical protein [Nevskiaceae bacterium]
MKIAAAALLCLPLVAQAYDGIVIGGEASAGYDTNITNAPGDAQPIASSFAEAVVQAQQLYALGEYFSVLARGSLRAQEYKREDGLGNLKTGALLRLAWRPGMDLYTPTVLLWSSASDWRYVSRLRDSEEYRGGVAWLQHLNTQFTARMSAGASARDGRSPVFDLRTRHASFDLDWVPAQRLSLHGGWQFIRGDIVASTLPDVDIAAAAKAKAPDDAYDERPARVAYRIAARTRVATAGADYALTHALSLDAQVQYVRARPDYENAPYIRWIGSAGLIWRLE